MFSVGWPQNQVTQPVHFSMGICKTYIYLLVFFMFLLYFFTSTLLFWSKKSDRIVFNFQCHVTNWTSSSSDFYDRKMFFFWWKNVCFPGKFECVPRRLRCSSYKVVSESKRRLLVTFDFMKMVVFSGHNPVKKNSLWNINIFWKEKKTIIRGTVANTIIRMA